MKANPYNLMQRPGQLLEASRNPKMKRAVSATVKRKAATGKVSHTGTFHGKSNALGQGGRAAQLKARGVPGGVIGNLARAAQAAPGQKNFHKRKAAPKAMEMAMKRSTKHKASGTHVHHHIHIHGKHSGAVHVHMKGSKVNHSSDGSFGDEGEQGLSLEHSEEGAKHFKKARKYKGKVGRESGKSFGDETLQNTSREHKLEKMHDVKKASKHKCKGSMCKHSSHKEKKAKKA